MANRYTTQFVNTLTKGVTKLFARVTFGATGAPTLVTAGFASQGVVSVTRDAQGLFTFVFGTQAGMLDVYYKLLGVNVLFDAIATTSSAGDSPTAPFYYLTANAVATPGSCSLQLGFCATANSATPIDPAQGEAIYVEFTLKNSTAP